MLTVVPRIHLMIGVWRKFRNSIDLLLKIYRLIIKRLSLFTEFNKQSLSISRQPLNAKKYNLIHLVDLAVLIAFIVITNPLEAKAYTDPGTGTFLMQSLLAVVTGVLFFFKVIRTRITAFFRSRKELDNTEIPESKIVRKDGA